MPPETRFTQSGEVSIAYQVAGDALADEVEELVTGTRPPRPPGSNATREPR